METDELDNLVEDRAKSFEPLRCPCNDQNNEMTSMLEQTFRMILLDNRTLVSCCHESCMQWEVTDDTVQLVRCIIKPGNFWYITNIFSLDDSTHFFICQVNGVQSKVSLHHKDIHAPLCEMIFDHLIVELILPLSLNHFLDTNEQNSSDLLVYSMKNPGQHYRLTLSDADFLSIKKLPGVNDLVIILYAHYIDIWTVSEKTYTLVNHYMLQSVNPAVEIEVIDRSHIILMSEHSSGGLQAETLLCFKEFSIVSETLMPDVIEGDVVCPFSINSVLAVSSHYDRMGNHEETYTIHSIVNNKQCFLTAGLYGPERHSLFCFILPNTSDIVVFTIRAKFFKYTIPQELADHIIYAELRKNARVLSQAHRTLSSHFARVPVEICLNIIALTDISLPNYKARRLASLYFCRPSCVELVENNIPA